jgi:carboxylesterase type B
MKPTHLLRWALVLLGSTKQAQCVPTAHDTKNEITYKGLERNGIEIFLNVTYGQDTGGAQRFKAPKAYKPASGSTIMAQTYGAACPQQNSSDNGALSDAGPALISEDCLNLNVARPNNTKAGDGLPVMVWIYGGSFWQGSNSEAAEAPDGLILESIENGLPVLHVAMNYRIGRTYSSSVAYLFCC